MRVALFGGTFDPIHRAHLLIAREAARAFALERVMFAPTGRQPLKAEPAEASYADRMAMVDLALKTPGIAPEGCEFVLSGLDAPRDDGEPNYTVDVLEAMRVELPGAELWAIAGADSFLSLRRWREPHRLLELADWIVVSRPGSALNEDGMKSLALSGAERERVHPLETVHDPLSATRLRERLRSGEAGRNDVLPEVLRYIRLHRLYGG